MRHLLPLYEYTKKDLTKPLKSFDLKGKLNPKVWQKEKVKAAIRKKLIAIADDFWAGMNLDLEYADIYFTGSLANFNWSTYSDFDLHLVVDFKKVNKDTSLVQKYFNEVKANWNGKHDITILGFDVELYVQDSAANAEDGTFISTGVYSLTNDKWVTKPQGFDEEVDKKGLEARAKIYMAEIDELEADLNKADYHVFKERLDRAWDKIIKGRKAGLMKDGELSLENLVFKLMRRNGYIEKIIDMKGLSYDRHLSIK